MERGVYFDAWFPRQHCYHPSLPPRRLRMVDDLVDYRATMLVWAAMGGGSLALPYLEQEAFGAVEPRSRFYGFVNDSEFIAACHGRGIKVFGIVFEAQGWEFPVELDEAEETVLALNELRGVGRKDWLGLREFSSNRYPNLWPPVEHYFPDGLRNSAGEPVTDLIEECVARDIDQQPCHARWVECPDREHQCFYMDRNNPVWREYLKAVIRIQIDAGVDGIQLDEAELPLGALQYGACFCRDCLAGFRAHLSSLAAPPVELAGVDLDTFHYGDWLLERGYDFRTDQATTPLFGDYYAYQCQAIATHFAELARYAREYGRAQGREVAVSGNFFNLDPHYLPLADEVDVIITEMRNTTYRQPEWYRYLDAFARYAGGQEVVVVENPYGGIVPDLVDALARGRGHDRLRLSLYEAAAFGTNMCVPYGSWLGATIQDSFWAPHDLLREVQDFVADTERYRSRTSAHEVAVVYSVPSMREAVNRADSGDNLVNARDESVEVPFRAATGLLSHASVPFDVLLFTDGGLAGDRVDDLGRYRTVVLPGCDQLTEHQATRLADYLDAGGSVLATPDLAEALTGTAAERLRTHPRVATCGLGELLDRMPDGVQVVASADPGVNVFRLADGSVAAHLINFSYDEVADAVVPMADLTLRVRLDSPHSHATVVRPGADPEPATVRRDGPWHEVEVGTAGLYTIVVFDEGQDLGDGAPGGTNG